MLSDKKLKNLSEKSNYITDVLICEWICKNIGCPMIEGTDESDDCMGCIAVATGYCKPE